jgi:hypothetical protein
VTTLLDSKLDTERIQNELATFVIAEEIPTMGAVAELVASSY